ncbi:MAG: leucine-rich repeat domain-containing protein [Treponema succinifaciens]|uniref:leucine-rich repeat domain-containing protein n=1 Tax=Treponema succinifaciens TaxID=167 RepID=UPI002A75CC6B|nr:leucine-rich repeat domain-containing protein [Treponema succinifaciens]MDY2616536.1 leucine-rich repeat domain-containing protein [Treponema succinifaciens]
MKKSIFLILPAVMLMLASCMDSASGNGGAGSVRVVLPGSSRDVSGSDRADSYTVSLLKGGKVIESQTAVPGGAVEFNELDAGSYTVDVEATLSGALSGVGSAEVAVTEGETASCSVLMNRVYTADAAVEYIESLEAGSYKVIVAGAIDDGGIEGIKTALNENNNKPLVSLDLGRTTGLSSIGAAKFQNCTALSAIVLPEGIGSIKESAFEGCTSLASVTIPDTVNEIGQSAFRDCSALKSIEIPNSVTTIASGVFRDCTALSAIVLPEGIDSINESAFEGCTSLASVTIPDTVTAIGQYAFCDCSALKSVVIPNNVTKISAAVFQSCTSLESAVISNTATSIGIDAFNSCTSLKTVVIPVSITSIGDKAFESCGSLETVYYGGTKAEWSGIKFVGSSSNDLSNVTIICSDNTITL